MNKLLKDQVAIVTGATAGIGKAIAQEFVENGAKVVVIGTNIERGQEVVQQLNQISSDSAYFFQVNVAKTQEVKEVVAKILEQFGQVDILVNNAGITRDQLLMKMSEEDWDNVLEVNVKSCYNFCQALVRAMMKARTGKIINISSVVGLIGNPGQVNYAASKAAMIGFTKALAKELAPRNICVNCIAPGFIETSMTQAMTEEQKKATVEAIPLKRMGAPKDIAKTALFIALSDYITGQVITVDGGMAI